MTLVGKTRKVRRSAAVLLAFVVLLLLTVVLRHRMYNSAATIQRIPLPSDYLPDTFAWLGPSNVLFMGRQGSTYDVRRCDLDANVFATQMQLARLFESIHNTNVSTSFTLRISNDGKQFLCVVISDTNIIVETLRIADASVTSSNDVNILRPIWDAFWIGNSIHWVACGYPSRAMNKLTSITDEARSPTVVTSSSELYPVGISTNNGLLLFEKPATEWIKSVAVKDHGIGGDQTGEFNSRITFPFWCNIIRAQVSPDGSRILWLLNRRTTIPFKVEINSHFPFLRFVRPTAINSPSSLWISNCDGSRFVEVTCQELDNVNEAQFEWSPDIRYIGALLRGRFYMIDIPATGDKQNITPQP